jgi:hypothetical protein
MYEQLSRALQTFQGGGQPWDRLLHAAEYHGLAPLLYRHLEHIGCTLPRDHHRTLRSLYQRSRFSAQLRIRAIEEIDQTYSREQLRYLPVKGIALANFVYDSAEYRPMRDIDILVARADLHKAERLLIELGYQRKRSHDIPEDYYHLPPLEKHIDGLPITIELHHDLLPIEDTYPRWPLDKALSTALPIEIGGSRSATLSLEDSLHYLYLHGFRPPLSYEEFRFIHLADLVSLVEKFHSRIDWRQAEKHFPQLRPVLSRFHFVTPWPDPIIDLLELDIDRVPRGAGLPYRGWPLCKPQNLSVTERGALLYETLLPPQWWLQVYYGHLAGPAYLKARFFEHPRTIWRWIKAYRRLSNADK